MENQDTLAHFTYTTKIIEHGFSEVLTLSPDDKFYPPLFHLIAAGIHYVSIVFVSTGVIPAPAFSVFGGLPVATCISYAWVLITAIIWPIGATLFAREVFDRLAFPFKPALYFICPILSLCFPCFPAMLLESGTLYPYTLAAAIMPFFLTFFIRITALIFGLFERVQKTKRRLALTIIEFTLCFGFLILSQPRILFLAALIIFPYLVAFLIKLGRKYKYAIKPLLISIIVIFILGVLSTIWFVMKKMHSDLLMHPEMWFKDHGIDMSRSDALKSVLLFESRIPPNFSTGINYLLFGLIISSILVLLFNKIRYDHAHLWLIISLLISQVFLFVIASGQSAIENIISAPWYKEFIRLGPALPLLATVMIALCLSYVSARFKWVGYPFLIIIVFALFINPQLKTTRDFIELENNVTSERWSLITSEKVKAMQMVANEIPENSLIINDPFNGSGYMYSFFDRHVIFDTMNPKYGQIPKQWMIVDGFTQSDPNKMQKLVCESPNQTDNFYFLDLGKAYTEKFSIYKQYLPFHNTENINKYQNAGFLKRVLNLESGTKENWALYKVNC